MSTRHIFMYTFLNEFKFNLRIWGCGSRYLYEFSLSNNYMSLMRTTTCDSLIVPSVYKYDHLPTTLFVGNMFVNNLLVSQWQSKHGLDKLTFVNKYPGSFLNLLYTYEKIEIFQFPSDDITHICSRNALPPSPKHACEKSTANMCSTSGTENGTNCSWHENS